MPEQENSRQSVARLFMDKQQDPPRMVMEELPTRTAKIFARTKQGTIFDPGVFTVGTPMIMGSLYFSGSHYDKAPGTHSLRITRRSVFVGSVQYGNAEVTWALRHSRLGTVDAIPINIGTRVYNRYNPGVKNLAAFGGPMNPLYAFGPGTLWSYFHKGRSGYGTMRVYASLEGIFQSDQD